MNIFKYQQIRFIPMSKNKIFLELFWNNTSVDTNLSVLQIKKT